MRTHVAGGTKAGTCGGLLEFGVSRALHSQATRIRKISTLFIRKEEMHSQSEKRWFFFPRTWLNFESGGALSLQWIGNKLALSAVVQAAVVYDGIRIMNARSSVDLTF